MSNAFGNGDSDNNAPSISSDFFTGSAESGLERIRTRLLDLTNRNKLLNYRYPSASCLRVVDASIDAVFTRLRDNEKSVFSAVPEPDYESENRPSAKERAEQLGWSTSCDLDFQSTRDESGRYLPVLHYHEELDTLSRKIGSLARTAIEESGTNMLHLLFGFLEWHESEDSQQPRFAPLVNLPVTLERSNGRGKAVDSILDYSGEDIETNLSLAEKLRRDFGIEMPSLDDEDTPESYFAKFEEILRIKKRWRIRRQITLALLSFGKLLMYRDLDPGNWPAAQNISKHALVRNLFEGTKSSSITLAEEYPIDAPELKREVPHLIRDADSSQHSALIHALRGQNLVIEGPPGTGKSQTITNLIAAALENGKTVLFVSEKLAALEVVRKRLDDAGLGLFCLELHSHKTKKGALLNDITQRWKARGACRDPRDLDRHLAIVEDKKKLLTKYASLINQTVQPFQATIFDILWARERWTQENGHYWEDLKNLMLPVAVQCDKEAFDQNANFLSIYSQHLASISPFSMEVEQHVWAWVTRPLTFNEEQELLRWIENLIPIIERSKETCHLLNETASIPLSCSLNGLESAAYGLTLFPDASANIIDDLIAPCRDSAIRQSLAAFIVEVEQCRTGCTLLSKYTNEKESLLNESTAAGLHEALILARKWSADRHPAGQVKHLFNECVEAISALEQAQSSFLSLITILECNCEPALETANHLLSAIELLDSAPFELLHLRHPIFESEATSVAIQAAKGDAQLITQNENVLQRDFDLALCGAQSPESLTLCSTTIGEASFLERCFAADYRTAVKTYRNLSRTRKKAPREMMSAQLLEIAQHLSKRNRFENNPSHQKSLGPHFRGLETTWEDLQIISSWYESVLAKLPEHRPVAEQFRRLLLGARVERLRNIRSELQSASEAKTAIRKAAALLNSLASAIPNRQSLFTNGSFHELLSIVRELSRDLEAVVKALEAAAVIPTTALWELPEALALAAKCRASLSAVEHDAQMQNLLGRYFRGLNTDLEPIKETVRVAELLTSGTIPDKTAVWLMCSEYRSRVARMRGWLSEAQQCATEWNVGAENIRNLSGSNIWIENCSDSFGPLRALAESCLEKRQELAAWSHFLKLRLQSKDRGFEKLTALADCGKLPAHGLVTAYYFCFYNTLAHSVFSENAELSQVAGVTQEQIRQQFATADKEAIRLYSERIAAQIDRRTVPTGNQSGPVRTWTEMALLNNEMNKQKRHIPIRQLMLRAANALVAIKPCFMMGPLSVAQYLAPGQIKFDLIIMDEASQLKPEDAIGALARGRQAIIVGDPKQLPPTTFFQRVAIEPDEEEEPVTAIEEGESILDVASTLFQPVRRLRWHYRSRHHSLIAFSNKEFYGDLIIFPSAYHDDASLGVKYHFVAGGVFENSRNPREAGVVVDAVLEHMRDHPDESLGVVTLNFEQRELVEDLLDRRLREDPAALAFQERMKGGQEIFFVKNLENVQGDERDVIFIATTYGPDARGNQFQRFGPINGPNGHRRLNVLFTRAKKRTVVFSSLDPDRIQTTANSPWGLRALKQYLIFARSGILQQPEEAGGQEANDFERSVSSVLKEKGYEVVPQVGVAGFFIDLGVRHPTKPGSFILGVECDGAAYHSGRSARDRDRLRQEILVNLGWKLHRIWSTDWFRNRDGEIVRLLARLDEILKKDPAYLQERSKGQRSDLLRKKLIELRECEIKSAFPDSLAEHGLLRKSLLDEFVETRPKSRDEWFRKIPQHLRTSVDSKQVAKYLDRVLEIIARSEV